MPQSDADSKDGEIWLINANIPEYLQANRFNHEPKRPRKLLLHRKQINKLMGAVDREGMTLIPLKLYFNERGRAKLLLAIAKGKKLHDKRETERNATGPGKRPPDAGAGIENISDGASERNPSSLATALMLSLRSTHPTG